jgi:hypothetical protein
VDDVDDRGELATILRRCRRLRRMRPLLVPVCAVIVVAGIAVGASAAGGASAAPAPFAPAFTSDRGVDASLLGSDMTVPARFAAVVEPGRAERTPPRTLARARTIQKELNRRIRLRPGIELRINEATTTASVESFTLVSEDLLERRFVPAAEGVWYAVCPTRAVCPYPAPRRALPAAHHLPRRLALELALRTFLETDATVVGVSLPTARFVAFVVAREELAREVEIASLYRRLRARPLLDPRAWLRHVVDRLTRPHTYVFVGFEPAPTGGISWAGIPHWPPTRDRDPGNGRPVVGLARV